MSKFEEAFQDGRAIASEHAIDHSRWPGVIAATETRSPLEKVSQITGVEIVALTTEDGRTVYGLKPTAEQKYDLYKAIRPHIRDPRAIDEIETYIVEYEARGEQP